MQILMNAETPLKTDYILASHERLIRRQLKQFSDHYIAKYVGIKVKYIVS